MTEEDSNNDAYREAQTDAKAAAARVHALRPRYRKKRYIIGIPVAALVALAVLGSVAGSGSDEDETAPSLSGGQSVAAAVTTAEATSTATTAEATSTATTVEATPTVTADESAGIGDLVSVGSLDLTVISVDTAFDSEQYNPFNEANVAIRVQATNARGDADEEYNLSPFFAMKLVDSDGIAQDPAFGCAGCPDEIDSVDLVRGGTVTGNVYFDIPVGKRIVELIYSPLFSSNKARVDLR